MRFYVKISRSKSGIGLYHAYKSILERGLETVDDLYKADVAILLGAWDHKLSRLAREARHMGMPYVVAPLGDLSPWNRGHPSARRWVKKGWYQRSLARDAACLIATTPMEKEQLLRLGWQEDVRMVRYPVYTGMATEATMAEGFNAICRSVLADSERLLRERIADMSDDPICRQLLAIYARMPHRDIPADMMGRLHRLLMADDYDEDSLAREIGQLRLTHFSASLFQAMRGITGLTEGFMPLPPREDRLARRIAGYVREEATEGTEETTT